MSLLDSWTVLKTALQTVDGIQVYEDAGASIQPPAAVIALPDLSWQTYNRAQPTSTSFSVFLVVKAGSDYALRLLTLVDAVSDALFTQTDAVITGASPGSYQTSSTELPCYVVTVEGTAD